MKAPRTKRPAARKFTHDEPMSPGMSLVDGDGRLFWVSSVTTRVANIETADGRYVETVSHGFIRCKYRIPA